MLVIACTNMISHKPVQFLFIFCRPGSSSYLSHVAMRQSLDSGYRTADLAAGFPPSSSSTHWHRHDLFLLSQIACLLYRDPLELPELPLCLETGLPLAACEEAQTLLLVLHQLIDMHRRLWFRRNSTAGAMRSGVLILGVNKDDVAFVW